MKSMKDTVLENQKDIVYNNTPSIFNHLITNCKLVSSREQILHHLPKNSIGCEVGVAAGDYSEQILKIVNPKLLHLVDVFNFSDYQSVPPRYEVDTHEVFIQNRFKKEVAARKVKISKGLSQEILKAFPDNYFDWLYLDAGHDYYSVDADVKALLPKMKNNSILIFNDYTLYSPVEDVYYGVVPVVNRLCNEFGYEWLYFA